MHLGVGEVSMMCEDETAACQRDLVLKGQGALTGEGLHCQSEESSLDLGGIIGGTVGFGARGHRKSPVFGRSLEW